MNFEEYLKGKKIDPISFKKREVDQYNDFEKLFLQMHPNSFTSQKLFLLNAIRRKYTLKEEVAIEKRKPQIKPKIVPRIKK